MTLRPNNPTERRLLALIESSPDPSIRENIAALPEGDPRTLSRAWTHCVDEARKHLGGHSGGVEDAVVLDWLAAYYAGDPPRPPKQKQGKPSPAAKPARPAAPPPRSDGLVLFAGAGRASA